MTAAASAEAHAGEAGQDAAATPSPANGVAVAADTEPPAELTEPPAELSADELLARARDRHGRYLRFFEAFVKDDMVQELLHDPYPPPVERSNDGHRQSLRKSNNDENIAATKSAGGMMDWVSAAFGSREDRESEVSSPSHEESKAKMPPAPPPRQAEQEYGLRAPEIGEGLQCDFEDDLDYLGKDVGTVEGLSDQACCELCARKKDTCMVAVMSSSYDEPPRACWLKTRISKAIRKSGVRACWPPNLKKVWAESHTADDDM